MSLDYEKIRETYSKLDSEVVGFGEIYTGETAKDMAKEKGISEEKWGQATAIMSLRQKLMHEEFSQKPPKTKEGREEFTKEMVKNLIEIELCKADNDLALKGMLLTMIKNASSMDEREYENLCRKAIKELKEILGDKTYDFTMNTVLPELRKAIEASGNAEVSGKKEEPLKNAEASATAIFLEDPYLKEHPEIIGVITEYASEVGEEYLDESGNVTSDVLDMIAVGLLVVAAVIAVTFVVLPIISAAGSTVAAELLVEHSLSGVGVEIAKEVAIMASCVTGYLKVACGFAFAGLVTGVVSLFGKVLDNYEVEGLQRVTNTSHITI